MSGGRPGKPWPPERRWGRGGPGGPKGWQRHRRWFFWRFLVAFSLLLLLGAGIMAGLTSLIAPYVGGGRPVSLLVVAGSCGLLLAVPLVLMTVAWNVFRRLVLPVAQVMAVTEAVAGGDLTARMDTVSDGRFAQLARSLNHMVDELERAEGRRRQLTADIAHELRTPLHIIQGNLEGVLDGVYEPTEAHIQNTLEETQLLARLVDDLGTLSLAESGQLPLILEDVDLAELLDDVATSFGGQAEGAGIALVVTAPPAGALVVRGDALRLDQVLSNLVANALRHTPAGGTIALAAAPDSTGARLTVADSGEGIPAADLPYVFDRFWRGDPARSHTAGAGAGLGLAIAQKLVEAHAGIITVDSAPGAGTTFTIMLPAAPP